MTVCDRVLFTLKKKNFFGIVKVLQFWVKIVFFFFFFFKFPFFLESFGLALLVPLTLL